MQRSSQAAGPASARLTARTHPTSRLRRTRAVLGLWSGPELNGSGWLPERGAAADLRACRVLVREPRDRLLSVDSGLGPVTHPGREGGLQLSPFGLGEGHRRREVLAGQR